MRGRTMYQEDIRLGLAYDWQFLPWWVTRRGLRKVREVAEALMATPYPPVQREESIEDVEIRLMISHLGLANDGPAIN